MRHAAFVVRNIEVALIDPTLNGCHNPHVGGFFISEKQDPSWTTPDQSRDIS